MRVLKWFWFSGRVRRATFCIVVAPLMILVSALLYLSIMVDTDASAGFQSYILGLFGVLKYLDDWVGGAGNITLAVLTYGLAIALPLYLWVCLATAVRRFHDRDKSGWRLHLLFYPTLFLGIAYLLLSLGVPIPPASLFRGQTAAEVISAVAAIWFFVELAFFAGTDGPNRYGPDPLA